MDDKELIWVPKEKAKEYEIIEDVNKQAEWFEEYLQKVSKSAKEEFQANLDILEEDVVVYRGLMTKVKQAFGAAKDEALSASYELWENYAAEKPNVEKKVKEITDTLQPLHDQLNEINELLRTVQTHNLDRFVEALQTLSRLSGENKAMIEFLFKHFTNT